MEDNNRLIYLLSAAQATLRGYVNDALSKAGLRVTISQATVLFLLERKDARKMSELATSIHADNSAMTRLIDRLEGNGLVERHVDPGNRRAILIRITPEGLAEEKKARSVVQRINRDIVGTFDREEIESYKKVLSGILDKFRTNA